MMRKISFSKGSWALIPALVVSLVSIFISSSSVNANNTIPIPNAGFEDNTFTGWSKGSQTGTLGSSITGNGSGVTIFNGSRTFTHGSHGAMGNPSSPYYAPAVSAGSWTFSPKNATYAVLLQPKGEQTYDQAITALGLNSTEKSEIQNILTSQASASGFGGGNPTDAAWITREVQLTAGDVYTMAWNYVGTDYVPYNDGSITSLVPVSVNGTPVITVNNYVKSYALLGFTNPGTGDYSTNSYGATGWQTSTYEVSISGTYKLGFTSFNLDDQGLPPALMVDSEAGSTLSCTQSGTCTTFGGVEPNNETAPTAPPTTVEETTTTTSTTSTTTTTTTPPTTTTIPPATSLEVTSLLDDGSSGTLRWAITQANATSGGIYDSIIFNVNGTITLTGALPQITQNLTITGSGRANTVIDGNNLYRLFYVTSGKTLTISDMTLKQGQSVNGGLIYNSQGTVVATNIRFTAMNGGSAVWNNNGGSTATYINCTFDYLNNGIAGDYGSTPQLAAGVNTWANEQDSIFGNKTYVNNCIFDHNNAGIYNYRFTKVVDSTFTNNGYAANITGLNRTQILNSTFDSNSIAIYHNAWIPPTFNMGTDNRLIDGNIFTNNNMAIYLDDGYNNGQKTPRWATVTNNSFDENGTWITYYLWNGTSNAGGTIGFNEPTDLFVHSANVSVATTTTTTTTSTVPDTTTTTVLINTTEPPTTEPEVINPPETLPEPSTTTSEPEPEVVTTEPEVTDSIPEETTTTVEPNLEPNLEPSVEEEVQEEVISEEITPEEVMVIVDQIIDASAEEVIAVLSALSGEEVTAVIENISAEQLSEVLDELPAEEVLSLIESIDSADALANVVDAISDETIDPDTAIAVIENGNFEELPIETVSEIFAAIEPDQFTDEQKTELSAALTEAPAEIKEAFEEEIDIYGDGFDDYVPTGSSIDVGTRKTVLAAVAATATIAAGAAASGGGTSGGGSSGGGSGGGSPSGNEGRSRREEDSGDEPSGEIAGPEDDDGEEFTRNSIFKYYIKEGKEMKKFNLFGFSKKIWDITAGLAFTLAGSLVVYVTLSGVTQRIAGIATLIAILVHYVHEILKNDE